MLKRFLIILLIFFAPSLYTYADDVFEAEINIKNHAFEPSELEIPAGRKVKLIVYNMDDTIEEFESFDLKREKIVPPGQKIHIILAPLAPGKYEFFGDFHQETARGFINVK
jgi:heme/copper-type cytochrome/quinol oxidase subunit 2